MRRGVEGGQSAATGRLVRPGSAGPGRCASSRRQLETTITSHGKPMRPYGSNDPVKDDDLTVRAVPLDTVRFEFVAAYPAEGGDAKAKREAKLKAFKRALKQARDNGLVGSREIGGIDYVWLVEPASAARGEQ